LLLLLWIIRLILLIRKYLIIILISWFWHTLFILLIITRIKTIIHHLFILLISQRLLFIIKLIIIIILTIIINISFLINQTIYIIRLSVFRLFKANPFKVIILLIILLAHNILSFSIERLFKASYRLHITIHCIHFFIIWILKDYFVFVCILTVWLINWWRYQFLLMCFLYFFINWHSSWLITIACTGSKLINFINSPLVFNNMVLFNGFYYIKSIYIH
jgi:hypothetical protein